VPEVTETQLPGVGVRHEFTTAKGDRLSVLVFRTGRREVAVYDRQDPDAAAMVLHLDEDDARTLNDLLGSNPVTEAVAGMQQIEGVVLDWIPVSPASPLAGSSIGDGQIRTRTGASVVAIVRTDTTIPAPDPTEVLLPGDTVVAVGTPEGLRAMRQLLGG
jgi:TrkA domain protein